MEKPKKKKKKTRSRTHGSKKSHKDKEPRDLGEVEGGVFKDKGGPPWKRQLLDLLTKIKLTVLSNVEKIKADPEYRQRLMTIAMAVVTVVVLLALAMNQDSAATNSVSAGRPRKSGRKKGNAPAVKLLTKREREIEEHLDIEGKTDLLSLKRRFTTNKEEYTQAQQKARVKLSAKTLECFRFSAQVTRDEEAFTYYTPRKVFDLPVLERSFKKLGYTKEENLKKASLVLKGSPRVPSRQLSKGHQYMDMVLSLGRIGSKKKTQLATLRNHVRKFKCTFESLNIQPKSFDMNKPSDCKKFFEYPDEGKMWVLKSCKSGEGSKGAGISVIDNLRATRSEWGNCEANAFNYVAQEYIAHPLLVKNRKFDMRSYLFVASTDPYVVFFNPGYLRRSLAEYNPSSTEKDDVLTNYHVQMNRKDFKPEDAMWSFPQFIEYLQEQDLCRACGDVEIVLTKISRLVFDAGRQYYKRFPGTFQIVGLDFMMDAYLNVYFIEGNVSPGIGSHGIRWKTNLMNDLITMIYQTTTTIQERPDEFDMRIGERMYGSNGNYWELIVHEQHEKCDPSYKFDPCKELKNENSGGFDEPVAAAVEDED